MTDAEYISALESEVQRLYTVVDDSRRNISAGRADAAELDLNRALAIESLLVKVGVR